jgi:hypothetical protein
VINCLCLPESQKTATYRSCRHHNWQPSAVGRHDITRNNRCPFGPSAPVFRLFRGRTGPVLLETKKREHRKMPRSFKAALGLSAILAVSVAASLASTAPADARPWSRIACIVEGNQWTYVKGWGWGCAIRNRGSIARDTNGPAYKYANGKLGARIRTAPQQ